MAVAGIYLLISLLSVQGGAVSGRLFFTQEQYQVEVSTSHPLEEPLVTMRLYNTSLSRGHSSAVCHIQPDNTPFTVTVRGTKVLLHHRQPLTEPDQYSISVSCGDNIEDATASTIATVSVLSDRNARQVPDINKICFSGFPDHVSVRENSTGLEVTELVGCRLSGCERFKRIYSIRSQQDKWKGYFSIDSSGRLWVNQSLDYEHVKEVRMTVTCNVTGQSDAVQRRNIIVDVININDVAPRIDGNPRLDKEITDLSGIESGSLLGSLIILDADGLMEGEAFVRGDELGQFNVSATVFQIGLQSRVQLEVKWAQKPVITNVTYGFEVVYVDRGYTNNYGPAASQEMVYTVALDIWQDWTVRDTAQDYSRVKHDLPSGAENSNYSVIDITGVPRDTFSITPKTGILYVNNSLHLTHTSNRPVTIRIQYKKGDELIQTDFKEIRIFRIKESEGIGHGRQCDAPCSSQKNKSACTSSCGVGVGAFSNTCSWVAKCKPYYAKSASNVCMCSQNKATCTDGVCDELEQLYPILCPFDCPVGVTAIDAYREEKRGLVNAHCWCQGDRCNCSNVKDDADKKYLDALLQAGIPKKTAPSCGLWCITLAVGGSLVVSFVVMVIALYVRYSYRRKQDKATPEKPLNGSVASLSATPSDYVVDTGDQQTRISSAASQNSLDWLTRGLGAPLAIDKKWEFPRKNLTLEKTLGEGEFGRVVSAQAYELNTPNEYTTVAIKMLKECATGSELRDLLSEYNLLKDVSHTNVIKLLGVCSKGGPFFLMVEYCEHGALRSYLRDCRLHEPYTDPRTLPAHPPDTINTPQDTTDNPGHDHNITANDLLSFAWQITKGMQYLSAMKLVHRDLAARNVLVATGKVIKISDFGLSRDIYEEDTYMKRSKGRIPVKWMAPESLYEQVYTTKSDVWSFGITLWEIVTLGATPYPGLGPERLYHRLKSGYRMEKPAHCSDQLFRVMSWCWRTLPGDRPTFTQLVDTMEVMLKQNVEYLDLGGALDRHPILDDDIMDTDDAVSDKEGGYGSISRLTEDNAYLNPASHAQHNFEDVVCDDCTMRMIKEGDVTTECTKLLGGNQGETESVNNNSSSNKGNSRPPLLYIQVEHENSDEESDGQVAIPVL